MCALVIHSLLTITLLKPVAPEPIDGTEERSNIVGLGRRRLQAF